MSELSRMERETGLDFSKWDAQDRLLALRAFGDAAPQITDSVLTYNRALFEALVRNLPPANAGEKQIQAAIAAIESATNNVSDQHIKEVAGIIARIRARLESCGLHGNEARRKH